MGIKYILSFPTSLIYHVLSQIDFREKWGDASIFTPEYTEYLLSKNNKELIIPDNKKGEIKTKLNDYFILITFACLRPWYINYDKLIKDFSDREFIDKKIINYSDLSIDKTEKAFNYLIELLEKTKKDYLIFWNQNGTVFEEKLEIFKKIHENIFKNYYRYLCEKINPEIIPKEKYFIFLIPSLFKYGRGLEGGCAIGMDLNGKQIKERITLSLHELTHAFSNPLLVKKIVLASEKSPNEMKNHQIKEQLAECILQKFLLKNYPDLARKENLNYPLLTEEIKKSLGIF